MNLHDLTHNKCIICAYALSRGATFCYCHSIGSYYNSHFVFDEDRRMRLAVNGYFIYVDFLIKNILIKNANKNKQIINFGNMFNINEFDLKNLKYEEQCVKFEKVHNKLKIFTANYNKNHMLYE